MTAITVTPTDDLPFVRILLGGIRRKLRYKHKDLRDVVAAASTAAGQKISVGELFTDPFFGWPYLLLFGLRWQDLKLSLDKCSEFIDEWVEEHKAEKVPLDSMGELILAALNKSGFVRIRAEGELEDAQPAEAEEGKEAPED
jgi:hypothetical protein